MGSTDPKVDAYIANSAEFAKPILNRIRKLVHAACPHVHETIKWTFPNFMYKGILCNMAAFKEHCTFGFWHPMMREMAKQKGKNEKAMGQLGRIGTVADLPPDGVLKKYIQEAMKLHDAGVKVARVAPTQREPLKIPSFFIRAIKANPRAFATFKNFSYSHKKEYVEWITGAKRQETRDSRMQKALQMLAAGKSQNWKYEKSR